MAGRNTISAKDWQVAGCGGVGVGPAGMWFYQFRSRSVNARFKANLAGAGLSLSLKGAVGTLVKVTDSDFTSIKCESEFSMADLSGSLGMISSISLSLGIGYSAQVITACIVGKRNLFELQTVRGPEFGLEAGISLASPGKWTVSGDELNYNCRQAYLPSKVPTASLELVDPMRWDQPAGWNVQLPDTARSQPIMIPWTEY